jgi:hypothetical protein
MAHISTYIGRVTRPGEDDCQAIRAPSLRTQGCKLGRTAARRLRLAKLYAIELVAGIMPPRRNPDKAARGAIMFCSTHSHSAYSARPSMSSLLDLGE